MSTLFETETPNRLTLDERVSPGYAGAADTHRVKTALHQLGYYPLSTEAFSPYPDERLFVGICDFQRESRLPIDGILMPAGDTVQAVNRRLENDRLPVFERIYRFVRQNEGGYEDRPSRIERPTHAGINAGTLFRFKKNHPELGSFYPNSPQELTPDEIRTIYKRDYYDKYRIAEIEDERLGQAVMDLNVMSSPRAAALTVQESLNRAGYPVAKDGILGSESIAALNKAARAGQSSDVITGILKEHGDYLQTVPRSADFLNGWLGRIRRY